MKPHKFHQTWLDLDHVLAITVSDTVMQVRFDMAFRDEPVYVNYWEDGELESLLDAWQKPLPRENGP